MKISIKRFIFEKLQKICVASKFSQEDKSFKVFCTTSKSVAKEMPLINVVDPYIQIEDRSEDGLESYQGIVTNAIESNRGIYILDKKIKLILSPLCIVSNVQILRKGQKVSVTNAHFRNVKDSGKILCACAKTTVNILNDPIDKGKNKDRPSLYDKQDMSRLKKDPVLNMCHEWNLKMSEILYIKDIYQNYLSKFNGIVLNDELESTEHFSKVLELIGAFGLGFKKSRCLITEYLSMPHQCQLCDSNQPKVDIYDEMYNKSSLISVKELKSLVLEKMAKQKETQKEKYNCTKFQYDYCIIPGDTLNLQDVTHSIEPTCASFDKNAELQEYNSVIGILDVDVTTG